MNNESLLRQILPARHVRLADVIPIAFPVVWIRDRSWRDYMARTLKLRALSAAFAYNIG